MTDQARTSPNSLDAERSLLGAMMLSRDALDIAFDTTTAEAFYRPVHGHIFHACRALHARGEPVDPVTVADELNRADLLDMCGGLVELLAIQGDTPATSNAGRYARIVEDHHLLRRLIKAAGDIAELGYTQQADVENTVDQAETILFALANQRRSRTPVRPLDETLPEWLDLLEHRVNQGELEGVPTGWDDLDQLLAGLRGGQLITCAARPAMGKSAMAAALAYNAAHAGHPTLFVSAEMSLPELQDRFVASAAQVDLDRIRRGRLAEADWPRLSNAVVSFDRLPLYVEDDPNCSLLTIRSTARRVTTNAGRLGLIIVDYLQLVNSPTRAENRQVEVAEISRGLKKLALELHVPIVALAQLNRNLEYRQDKRPMLADLRESGAIENDSDVVTFLYRDEVYNPETKTRGVCEVIVAKQRNGPLGTVRLAYDPRYGRFNNLATREEGAA